ncbi:MAG TPA: ABC transporter ATP-binding protein [Candidatus Limiplasma sp.]|nr:ABC transporter ATP-binding protein [Candidatus Limiplasma sp.]HPS81276.1 ABC transporter ATP-binding protein [Candidatus Limiplasma sp.]
MSIVEIQHLKKYYGHARGIEDVNLSLEEGEIFGFIGPNGAGKSTTIRTLLALIRPTAGSATIFGKDCIRCAPEIAQDVGYLPSEVFYYDGMRVKDLLAYSASFYRKNCDARIRALAERLDLDLKKKIDDLSFGNRKKVGIVQAMLHEPKLLILDEPTSGLDPLMQQRFFELLREDNRKGTTVLFSSHVLSEVRKICDRVAIIRDGRIVNVDTVNALQDNGYKKVTLETRQPLPEGALAAEGVTSLSVQGGAASFLYQGAMPKLLTMLAALEPVNVTIGDPDLEEIFLHYYQ